MAAKIKQEPAFHDEAAAVMSAPYWQTPSVADAKAQVKAAEARFDERQTLSRALAKCQTYADLKGAARAIYDRAKKTLD